MARTVVLSMALEIAIGARPQRNARVGTLSFPMSSFVAFEAWRGSGLHLGSVLLSQSSC